MPSFGKKTETKKKKTIEITDSVESMLKYISEKDGRSQTKEIEYLIRKRYTWMKDIEAESGIII